MSVCLSVYLRFTLEQLKLNPQTHKYIYLESVSPRKHFKYIYMATPLSVLQKKKRKWNFFQKKEWSYRPKNSYAYNLTLGVTWGGFQNLAIPLPLCIRLKCQKWFKKKTKHLDVHNYIHEPIYLESVSPRKHFKNVCKATPISMFVSCQKKKEPKMILWPNKPLEQQT